VFNIFHSKEALLNSSFLITDVMLEFLVTILWCHTSLNKNHAVINYEIVFP